MKQVSQEEFEQYIEKIINGEMSKAKVIKELSTEARTLNNRIQELSAINSELYSRYIEKFPYTPRTRKDLDAMQLAMEILAQGKTVEEVAINHKTGRRTIQRRINSLGASDNILEKRICDLCKEAGRINSRGAKRPEQFEKMIEEVVEQIQSVDILKVKDKQSNVEEKRTKLLELEREYNELCKTMSKDKAAKTLGYTPNRIYKLLRELYRIEIERNTSAKKGDFRQGLRVDVVEPKIQLEKASEKEQKKEERE